MRRQARAHLAGIAALFLLVVTNRANFVSPGVPAKLVLRAWKASLGNPTALSSWDDDVPVCDFYGVLCQHTGLADNTPLVTGLVLGGLGLSGGSGKLNTMDLSGLTELYLNGNNLIGPIPDWISWLIELTMLDLSSNRFDGSIMPYGGLSSRFIYLRLHHNNLAGDIPHQLCSLVSLKALDLSNNWLTGNLPDCLCNLQSLLFLDLSNNQLTGELPDCWWNLRALEFIDLSNNSFSGQLPNTKPSHVCSLKSVYLARNGFVGAFPPVLKGCNSLETLDIGNNMFSGAIPAWIGSRVPSLRILSLKSNNFTEEIPMELSYLSKLQLLDLANNRLRGSIPAAFNNLTSMSRKPPHSMPVPTLADGSRYLDRIDIYWKGQELIFQRTIKLLVGIDLSGNLLSQCIPEVLTKLHGLRFLNLSRNHLSCNIPQEIGNLSFLEFLDLSSNELSGEIPPSISSLLELSTFNVSNNLLSGKIPSGSQMQTLTDPSIYSNNSGLCGFPLDIPCANTSLAHDDRNVEAEDYWMYCFVIVGVAFGFLVWFGTLFAVKTWRCAFLFFVDGLQCKITKYLWH